MAKKLNILILSSGRFHLLDLARELCELGHEVKFYSYVPKKRAILFGLPEKAFVGFFPYLFPLVAWQFFFPNLLPKTREWLLNKALNYLAIFKMQECDVIIGMSGIYLEALKYGKTKYSAEINLHRGSKHILAQNEILKKIVGAERPSKNAIYRELKGYELANSIIIPSKHVYDSFGTNPDIQNKCEIIPYGVSLNSFPIRKSDIIKKQTVGIYVGIWSFQKGCDLLQEIFSEFDDLKLIHVGDIGDVKVKNLPNIEHVGRVDQSELFKYYHIADFFVLASRQDGFGMVLSQALACGLPILTTLDTGGSDLQLTPALRDRILLVKSDDLDDLTKGFKNMLNRLKNGPRFLELTEKDRLKLSWKGYGEQYNQFFQKGFK